MSETTDPRFTEAGQRVAEAALGLPQGTTGFRCGIREWHGARKPCTRPAEFSVRNAYNHGSTYGPQHFCATHLPVFLRSRNGAQHLVTPLTTLDYVYDPNGSLINNPDLKKEEVQA